jgi:hypothetical protein
MEVNIYIGIWTLKTKSTQYGLYGQVTFKNARVMPWLGDRGPDFLGVTHARHYDVCNACRGYLESPQLGPQYRSFRKLILVPFAMCQFIGTVYHVVINYNSPEYMTWLLEHSDNQPNYPRVKTILNYCSEFQFSKKFGEPTYVLSKFV